MSDDFHPGEGWREVPGGEPKSKPNMRVTQPDGSIHWYEHLPPVPPLPTEPYTVIRIHHINSAFDGDVVTLGEHGWGLVGSDETAGTAPKFLSGITGFEILAEPRAGAVKRAEASACRLTAKAVLVDVVESGNADGIDVYAIAAKYGVEL